MHGWGAWDAPNIGESQVSVWSNVGVGNLLSTAVSWCVINPEAGEASPAQMQSISWYQIIFLGHRSIITYVWTTCPVVTWKCNGQESNPRPVQHTQPLHCQCHINNYQWCIRMISAQQTKTTEVYNIHLVKQPVLRLTQTLQSAWSATMQCSQASSEPVSSDFSLCPLCTATTPTSTSAIIHAMNARSGPR